MALFSYARGREAYWDDGYSEPYGRSVAEMHTASDGFRSQYRRFHLDFTVLLDRPLARMEPVLAHRPADWHYVVSLAAEIRRQVEALAAAGLDWGFCHGDTLGSNAYRDGDVITHFDFDDCGPGWRAYDLATYVWIWTWHEKPERGEEFLRGYRERRPVAANDLRALPLFVVLREFWVVGQQTLAATTLGHTFVADSYVDARLRFLHSWEAQL
jgi:Ser/Thr protein kinase RdoA (MazF antagonist)